MSTALSPCHTRDRQFWFFLLTHFDSFYSMNKLILLILFSLSYCSYVIGQDSHIHFIEKPDSQKISIYIDQVLFTEFLYSDTLYKQVLYPIYTASGTEITAAIPPARKPMNRQTILTRWGYGLASEISMDWISGIIRIAFPMIKKNSTALSGLPASRI